MDKYGVKLYQHTNFQIKRRFNMDIEKLIEEIKKDEYSKPKIGIISPEIRTINERVNLAVDNDNEVLTEEELNNIEL